MHERYTTQGVTIVEGGIGLEIPALAGLGLVYGVYVSNGEFGFFQGLHGGILGPNASIGQGFTAPKALNGFLSRLLGIDCPVEK